MSQSLLFRSAVWFVMSKASQETRSDICRNPFYSGLLFDSVVANQPLVETVIVSRNPFYSGLLFDSKWRLSGDISHQFGRNPFYSGLLFDSSMGKSVWNPWGWRCRNPFYSGLLFDSTKYDTIRICKAVGSQSLLFRSAVWFEENPTVTDFRQELVAIPSIQVCCLIRENQRSMYFHLVPRRNPFYSGLLFDSAYLRKYPLPRHYLSQSLLFRSAVWFNRITPQKISVNKKSQSLLFRSAVWFSV